MGLGASITTFTPHTTMNAAAVNSNFANLNTVSVLSIPFVTFSADTYQIQSDGNGNLNWTGGFGSSGSNYADLYDGSSTISLIKCGSTSGKISFEVPSGTAIMTADNVSGWVMQTGKVTFTTGSLRRLSSFTGAASGSYNHGLGVTPSVVLPMTRNSSPQHMGYSNVGSTNVTISAEFDYGFWCLCLGF